ncbi:RHS repeat domain-containing protein [Chondromyces crocatus]|uniref:RHS repeat domain-containing protein n=1 Tax=Chondromyces crocatus TaxID=52 RepID=UPI0012E2A980|nr:RHS repeat-associated core domain-containing protein [Chondromyces crocatus]
MVETLIHDAYGEVIERNVVVDGSALMTVAYSRDLLGRIVEKTETLNGITHVTGYDYDLAGHLRDVYLDSDLALHIDHDENGNPLARVTPDSVVEGHFDAQDRLLFQEDLAFAYDDAGTLQSRTDTATGDTTNYGYDDLGNLRQVTLPGGTVIDYVVDGLGRRVGKKVDGALVKGWLYRDRLQPAAELGATGAIVARFIYGDKINVPEIMLREGVAYRLVSDHVGSVRLVVNAATGAIAQRIDYDAFGRVLLDTNPGFQPFGFAGGLYDPDAQLVRFGARDYDAEAARWTSKDPLLFDGGDMNLYSYSAGDPVNRVDPMGKAVVILPLFPLISGEMVVAATAATVGVWAIWEGICAMMKPTVAIDEANPDSDDYQEACLGKLWLCQGQADQPVWNQADFGKKKDCAACYRHCMNEKGIWPYDKCPE